VRLHLHRGAQPASNTPIATRLYRFDRIRCSKKVAYTSYSPEQQVSDDNQAEAAAMDDIAFTPIAMPLLSGPGSIAVTISMATTVTRPADYGAIAIGIVLVALLCWLVLHSSAYIVEHMSSTGMNVLTRLMGFILVCIGIQFIATGIFEALTNPDLIGPIVKTIQSV
jgi:multiple antibiotic resistance protein